MLEKKEVERVARIARLKLSSKEKEKFASELEEILQWFESLDKVDTKGVKPAIHPRPLRNRFRQDKQKKPMACSKALANSKHKKKGFIKGPALKER